MKVTKQVIDHVAALARLELTEDEALRLMNDMEQIIRYVDHLNELDTEGITPREHVMNINNVLRDDIVMPSMTKDDVLMNAPSSGNGCFKVPRIVE